MTLVVFGIDALDADLVVPEEHPNLALETCDAIGTIASATGEPSTHELWPTIITGLEPAEHGLTVDDGVAWENPLLRTGSRVGRYLLPAGVRTRLGAWLLNNTSEDAFRTPATYYERNAISTVFDGRDATAIGVPNYVVDPATEDREHQLRREMGELFERDPDAKGGHTTVDPRTFYEQCLEMTMIRTARTRRALRSRRYELVFGYTSGLDLVGHVSHDRPAMQRRAYGELNEFVGELRGDLADGDELVLVSDHGLQDGLHTDEAMVASTSETLVEAVSSVTDVRAALEAELRRVDHTPEETADEVETPTDSERVVEQLRDLGYM